MKNPEKFNINFNKYKKGKMSAGDTLNIQYPWEIWFC